MKTIDPLQTEISRLRRQLARTKFRRTKRLLLALATLILLSVLVLTVFGSFSGGLFQEPYTGGWLLCLAGKCWSLP